MPLCRRRGGGREDESGLVVESEDNSEEMVNQVRPTGQMDTIRYSIRILLSLLLYITPHFGNSEL